MTPSYFRLFGAEPMPGRLFDSSRERYGHAAAAVVSYPFWQNHSASDPLIVGKTIRVNGQPYRHRG